MKILVLAGLLAIGAWLVRQLIQITLVRSKAKRSIAAAIKSAEHPAKVKMFIDAQSNLMKMDLQMGGVFLMTLVVVLVICGYIARDII